MKYSYMPQMVYYKRNALEKTKNVVFLEVRLPLSMKTIYIYVPNKHTMILPSSSHYKTAEVVQSKDGLTTKSAEYLTRMRGYLLESDLAAVSIDGISYSKFNGNFLNYYFVTSQKKDDSSSEESSNDEIGELENKLHDLLGVGVENNDSEISSSISSSSSSSSISSPSKEEGDDDRNSVQEAKTQSNSNEDSNEASKFEDDGEEVLTIGENGEHFQEEEESEEVDEELDENDEKSEEVENYSEEEKVEEVEDEKEAETAGSGEEPIRTRSTRKIVLGTAKDIKPESKLPEKVLTKNKEETVDKNDKKRKKKDKILLEFKDEEALVRKNYSSFHKNSSKGNSNYVDITELDVRNGMVYICMTITNFCDIITKNYESTIINIYSQLDENEQDMREERVSDIEKSIDVIAKHLKVRINAINIEENSLRYQLQRLNTVVEKASVSYGKGKDPTVRDENGNVKDGVNQVYNKSRRLIHDINVSLLKHRDEVEEILLTYETCLEELLSH